MATPASRGRATRTFSYEARPSRASLPQLHGYRAVRPRATVIPGYAFIDSAHGCSVVTNRPACPFEESEITVPHKSRPPDAISKPSHPQYFHIK